MSRGSIGQWKRLSDHRFDFSRLVHAKELVELSTQKRTTGLQASQIYSDHRQILAHHFQRMKLRSFEKSLQSAHPASFSIRSRRGGKAEYHKPARRTEARLALRERDRKS